MELQYPVFWRNASSKRKRIYLIIIVFIIAFVVTVIGSYVPLSHSDAQTIYNQENATLTSHKSSFGSLTAYLFINNFSLCLLMFVPFIGLIVGMFIIFDSGLALGAISTVKGYPPVVALIIEVILPIFWLEFLCYSVAMAESVWLSRRLMQRRWYELKNTVILIGVCAAILLGSAALEAWLIGIGV